MENEWIIELIIFIIGICIGSFLNVVIYRVPKSENIAYPPSHCPKCGKKLKPWHNIPIISYVLLKGKCAFCREKIPIRYPVIELSTGILAVLIYKKCGVDIYSTITFIVFALFLALSMIDFDYKAVPDSLNLLALTLSFFTTPEILENFKNALILMGGMSLIRYYVSYFIKREAMGEGDIILAGSIGALLGIKLSLFAIFIASLIAIFPSLYNRIFKKDFELPFIPFLTLGTFIVWYFNDYFLNLWSKLYG
ncbi:leader peptidase/N-methyltransferase [Lebetimonas natsushimae]|uniref:Leader peptidase/N-methyltransferase n=1 Tax=Lebetimonas natsushimae TaxID=1936991 RepID=A0A292YB93_9BACT|nr:A24 family peptidase [Lebetimonas natsushimae]GAX87367.1 leader peptidase/N-methyltransferase [Lebetimonas natsushimae]